MKTHSAGVPDKDFALTRQIEAVVLWRPPAGGPSDGPARKWLEAENP